MIKSRLVLARGAADLGLHRVKSFTDSLVLAQSLRLLELKERLKQTLRDEFNLRFMLLLKCSTAEVNSC